MGAGERNTATSDGGRKIRGENFELNRRYIKRKDWKKIAVEESKMPPKTTGVFGIFRKENKSGKIEQGYPWNSVIYFCCHIFGIHRPDTRMVKSPSEITCRTM